MHRRFSILVTLTALLALVASAFGQADRTWIVVHPPGLADAARQWMDYRRQSGWDATAIDVSEVAPADQDATAIALAVQSELRRRFTRDQQRVGAGRHEFAVLLLGPVTDDDGRPVIPMWYRPQQDPDLIGREGLADIATDLNYQFADDRDDLPDFPLGRIPARTTAEALAALDKVRRYETQAPGGPWRKRLTYLAGEGGFGALDALLERLFIRMVDQVVPYEFDVGMTYANPRSPYCAPPSRFSEVVLDRFSEGALLVNYVGHGHVNRLDQFSIDGEQYDVCNINSLRRLRDSGNRLPIALLVACWTGRIDLPADRRGLGEMMLFNPDGPVAVVAAGRITHPYANALVQKNFTQQLCVERRATVGATHLEAMRALAHPDQADRQLEALAQPIALAMKWATTPADLRLMHIAMYGLLGDPATRIAYPMEPVADWSFDPVSGRATGVVAAAVAGHATLTVETRRESIPRLGEMRAAVGLDPAGRDKALTHNYALANDKVLWRTTVALAPGGRFDVTIPREALARTDAAWIKVYVAGKAQTGGAVDAFACVQSTPRRAEPLLNNPLAPSDFGR